MNAKINRATSLATIFNFATTPEQHKSSIDECIASVEPLFKMWDANGDNAHELFTEIDYHE